MISNKARAYFALGGYHFDPAEITRQLGIDPTSTHASGNTGMDRPATNSWELSTKSITNDIDVYKLMDDIVKQLAPVKDQLKEVIKNFALSPRVGVVMTLSIDKNEISPEVGFSSTTIRFLADIGAFINIDYDLSERV